MFQSAPGSEAGGDPSPNSISSRRSFQSAPGSEAGGDRDQHRSERYRRPQVSIRPRLGGRGTDRRRRDGLPTSTGPTCFNPPPARRPGEIASPEVLRATHPELVSIRPRLGGRGRRGLAGPLATNSRSFNPPPARRPGNEYAIMSFDRCRSTPVGGQESTIGRCFNPPPARRPGETPTRQHHGPEDARVFQSAPGSEAGGDRRPRRS